MIVYFSGTGNSRAVAESLGKMLELPVVKFTEVHRLSIAKGNDIIWVFPVHSWGVPMKVRELIGRIESCDGDYVHHMVATCGDDCGLTDRMWREVLEQKGWKTGCAYTVRMPNTYVTFPFFDVDAPDVRDRKLTAMRPRLERIADDIRNGRIISSVTRGAFPRLKSDVIYPFFMKKMINPGKFSVNTGECVSCGLCVRSCPLGNIVQDSHVRPTWGDDCCLCLSCYHHCPTHAISYGKTTDGKGQYYFGMTDRKQ